MYDEHKCEVSQSDLSSLRYDLERLVEELRWKVNSLSDRLDSLRSDLNSISERSE